MIAKGPREFARIWKEADAAGKFAATSVTPPTMYVSERENPLDDKSPIVKNYAISDGPCGFAEIRFKGNTSFGRWAKKVGAAKTDSYYGGLYVWVSAFNQSMVRKESYARAFAKVLKANGIDAYSTSRMD